MIERGSRIPRMKDWNDEMRDKTSLWCVQTKVIWGEMYLCNITSKKSKQHNLRFPCQLHYKCYQGELQRFPGIFSQPPPFLSGWEYWGKVQWPLSGNQLIFILGREEWVECIDVQTQTTALCVLETPDTWRNECLDNQVDCEGHSLDAHLGYATWKLH